MAFLVHNLPPIEVFVKKEYLYDHQKGFGELTEGMWISVKSVESKALYFETMLLEYGALYDKLPLSAFVWTRDYDKSNQLPLDHLQIWDCFDYDITVVQKPILGECSFFGKDKKMHRGEYEFTIDTCHRDKTALNQNFSEHDPEHKSFNIIRLHNGQFAAQPNNRILWDAPNYTTDREVPDYTVQSTKWNVENKDWLTEDSKKMFYKIDKK